MSMQQQEKLLTLNHWYQHLCSSAGQECRKCPTEVKHIKERASWRAGDPTPLHCLQVSRLQNRSPSPTCHNPSSSVSAIAKSPPEVICSIHIPPACSLMLMLILILMLEWRDSGALLQEAGEEKRTHHTVYLALPTEVGYATQLGHRQMSAAITKRKTKTKKHTTGFAVFFNCQFCSLAPHFHLPCVQSQS